MATDKLIHLRDAMAAIENNQFMDRFEKIHFCATLEGMEEAIEVVPGYHVGDVCFYGIGSHTKCLALVEIQKILDDERGVAEIKFLKVFADTGNNFFDYLLRTGQTMNGSFEYLKNITPKRDETKG